MISKEKELWCLARLVDYELGLLVPEDLAAVEDILVSSDRCREAYEALHTDAPPDEYDLEHIPVDMIARWDRVVAEVKGLERALLRSHLEKCQPCCLEIELSGGIPLIPFESDLDYSEEDVHQILGDIQPEPPAPEKIVPKESPDFWRNQGGREMAKRNWAPWAISGWGLAAAAALFIFLVQPPGALDPGGYNDQVLPTLALRTVRSHPMVLAVKPNHEKAAIIARVPNSLSSKKPMVIEVNNSEDQPVWRISVQPEDLTRGEFLFTWTLPQPLIPGIYKFQLWNGAHDSDPIDPVEEFRIKLEIIQ